jgi:hypothetical protein
LQIFEDSVRGKLHRFAAFSDGCIGVGRFFTTHGSRPCNGTTGHGRRIPNNKGGVFCLESIRILGIY